MTNLGKAEAPPSQEELLRALSPAFKTVIDQDVDGESDPEKTWQYNNARRNYFMFRGLPYLAPVNMGNGYSDYAPIGNGFGYGGVNGSGGEACYDYTRNLTRGKGIKYIAVVGQRAPNVTAVADDPQDEKSMRATRQGNELNAILNAWWSVDERNIEIATVNWITGPAYLYTPYNADGQMYGWREEPKYKAEMQPVGEPSYRCMNCGEQSPNPGPCPKCAFVMGDESMVEPEMVEVPVPDGVTRYPNGRVECYVLDCTMVSTPFYAKSDLKYCPWLKYEYEENRAFLIQKYPQLRDKPPDWGSISGTSSQGRQTREAIISPSGSPIRAQGKSRWLYSRVWLQAKEYNLITDEGLRKMAEENYPEGVKVTRVNGEIMELEDERLDKVWAAIQPSPASYLNADPVMTDLVSAAMLENHMLNISAETLERGNPLTFVDPTVINVEQWNRQSSKPNMVIPALAGVGKQLGDAFHQTQPSRFSEQQEPWIASVVANASEDVGTVPEIFGGGSATTARQAEINKNAAMMQLGLPWLSMRKAWERAKHNAVLQLVKYGPAMIREGRNMAELAELTSGAWHFESDEAIPATWGQMRDWWQELWNLPEPIQQAMGVLHPKNIAVQKSLFGMQGVYTPGLDDMDAVQELIHKLMQGEPIQTQNPDGSTDTQPSIPVDGFVHNPELVVQVIQAWAQKASLSGGEMETNPAGFSNVLASGIAYKKLLDPAPPVAPPVAPKMSVSISSKDLLPNQTAALLEEANMPIPPPEFPPQMMGPQGPPVPPVEPQGPPTTIQ